MNQLQTSHPALKQSAPESHVANSPRWLQPAPTLPGLDGSHWSYPVHWGNAAFAWFKATQGVGYHDHSFEPSVAEARARSIFAGAYHYFTPDDPVAQARHFVQVVGKNTDIGYALDWEEHPNLISQAVTFKHEVEQLTGRAIVLYSYLAFLEGIGAQHLAPFAGNPLWLADLSHGGPHIPAPFKSLFMWQYKFGSAGMPDLDVFFGDLSELKKLIK